MDRPAFVGAGAGLANARLAYPRQCCMLRPKCPPRALDAAFRARRSPARAKESALWLAGINLVVLLGHGITPLGRTISEAYTGSTRSRPRSAATSRQSTWPRSRARRRSTAARRRSPSMHKHAEAVIYPTRTERVMQGRRRRKGDQAAVSVSNASGAVSKAASTALGLRAMTLR